MKPRKHRQRINLKATLLAAQTGMMPANGLRDGFAEYTIDAPSFVLSGGYRSFESCAAPKTRAYYGPRIWTR